MTERAVDPLVSLLQQLRLQQPHSKSPSEATQAQLELFLNRIASLTGALRDAPPGDASAAAARLLLADLAMVAAQFRGRTSELGERLAQALERAELALQGGAGASAASE